MKLTGRFQVVAVIFAVMDSLHQLAQGNMDLFRSVVSFHPVFTAR